MTTFKNPVFRYIFPWEVIKYIISLQMKSLLIISPQSYHNWFCTMVWHKDENTRIFELLLHLILSDIWRNIKETSLWLNWMHSCRKTRCDQTDVKKTLHKFNTLMLHIYQVAKIWQVLMIIIHIFQYIWRRCNRGSTQHNIGICQNLSTFAKPS